MTKSILAALALILATGCAVEPDNSGSAKQAAAACEPCQAFDQCVTAGRPETKLNCNSDGGTSHCTCDTVATDGVTPVHAECVIPDVQP